MNLDGTASIVTGGGRGIGRVVARCLADAGSAVDSATSPPEAAGELVVRLARGDADALSGRYIHVTDDLDGMLEDAERIVADDLLGLRLAAWDGK